MDSPTQLFAPQHSDGALSNVSSESDPLAVPRRVLTGIASVLAVVSLALGVTWAVQSQQAGNTAGGQVTGAQAGTSTGVDGTGTPAGSVPGSDQGLPTDVAPGEDGAGSTGSTTDTDVPPAGDTTPPAGDTAPPAGDTAPPAPAPAPPAGDAAPPAPAPNNGVIGGAKTGSTGPTGYDMRVLNVKGGIIDLSQWRGKPVVIWRYWPGCGACISWAQSLQTDYPAFTKEFGNDAVFLAMGDGEDTPKSLAENVAFMDKHKIGNIPSGMQRYMDDKEPGFMGCFYDVRAKYFSKIDGCESDSYFFGLKADGTWEEIGTEKKADFIAWTRQQLGR